MPVAAPVQDLDEEGSPPLERVYFGPTIGWLNTPGGIVAIGVPASTPLLGTETVPGVQAGGNVDIGVQDIANLATQSGTALANLPAATALLGTELFYVVQGGVDAKATTLNLRTLNALTFATLPTPVAGMTAYITDCNTVVWGANAAGSGTHKVMVWYNGTNWTVIGI